MGEFRKSLRAMQEYLREELGNKEQRLLESMIQALQFDRRVELELHSSTISVLRMEFGIEDDNDMQVFTDAVVNLGYGLYCELKRLNAYQNGYLYYHYYDMLGSDIVMQRLDLPMDKAAI